MMASPVFSQRFFQARNLSGGSNYTVPDGFRAVVRDIDVFDGSVTGDNVFQAISDALGQTFAFWRSPLTGGSLNAGSWFGWRGRQVFFPDDTITFFADSGLDVTVSGYLLTLP